jgi:hypothetical protein
MDPNSFAAFSKAVEDSITAHAKRKNYTDNGPDGLNKMLVVMNALGLHEHHAIGEIIYKAGEYLKTPRRVLLEKIAGWAFVLWRETSDT